MSFPNDDPLGGHQLRGHFYFAQEGTLSLRYNIREPEGTRSASLSGERAIAWAVRARAPWLAGLLPAIGLWAALAAATAIAQNQPPLRDNRRFQSGIEVTSITATVTDRDGHLITGLGREAFEIYEHRPPA